MNHLTSEVLAGYLDNALPAEERRQAELHLASCGECRTELAQVRGLQRRREFRWSRPALVTLAAAAAILIAVVIPRQGPTPSNLRAADRTDPLLEVVSPVASQPVTQSGTFIWRSAGSGASYTFTLQQEAGAVAWSSTTVDTLLVVPDSIRLQSGRTWFWYVDALLPDGQSLSTGVQRLRIDP